MSKFIVVPAEIMNQVPQLELDALHLNPRYNTEGTEAILHVEHYEALFPQPVSLSFVEGEESVEPIYPFPVFDNPSDELNNLINSNNWRRDE